MRYSCKFTITSQLLHRDSGNCQEIVEKEIEAGSSIDAFLRCCQIGRESYAQHHHKRGELEYSAQVNIGVEITNSREKPGLSQGLITRTAGGYFEKIIGPGLYRKKPKLVRPAFRGDRVLKIFD